MSALHEALVAALAELTVVESTRTAKVETKGGNSYTYGYADIADAVRYTRPVLAKHGLVALTPVHEHKDGLACSVILVHSSGETLDFGPLPFPAGPNAQATGSAITYHRRYALLAALGIGVADDDDGKAATRRAPASVPADKSWSDTAERDVAWDALKAESAELPPAQAKELREWLRTQGFRKSTFTHADSVRWDDKLNEIAHREAQQSSADLEVEQTEPSGSIGPATASHDGAPEPERVPS